MFTATQWHLLNLQRYSALVVKINFGNFVGMSPLYPWVYAPDKCACILNENVQLRVNISPSRQVIATK